MKSNQNHPGGGPRKNTFLARQSGEGREWFAIKSNTLDHYMEDDKN